MEFVTQSFPLWLWAAALGIAFLAGLIKGIVGFALPLVLLSGLGALTSPELAVAGLILPTVATNVMQALRLGWPSARRSAWQYRRFMYAGGITLLLAAQLVPLIAERAYMLVLGVAIMLFILAQLMGWSPARKGQTARFDLAAGAITGVIGGISGTWGPPTVAYLTALGTAKATQIQVQGIVFFAGAVALVLAHAVSGILTLTTALFSLCLVPPSIAGMWAGTAIQDRINQETFRRATLFVLLIAGLNLVRRGVFG